MYKFLVDYIIILNFPSITGIASTSQTTASLPLSKDQAVNTESGEDLSSKKRKHVTTNTDDDDSDDDDNDGILDSVECPLPYVNITANTLGISGAPFSNTSVTSVDISDSFGFSANSGAIIISATGKCGF